MQAYRHLLTINLNKHEFERERRGKLEALEEGKGKEKCNYAVSSKIKKKETSLMEVVYYTYLWV